MTGTPSAEDRRIATLHLRLGNLALARAELEDQHRREELDTAGLADLAEARWRTGSLEPAGQAAVAHLAAGGSRPIARVIAAEAAAARGDPIEARTHVDAVDALAPGVLDQLFAGIPRRPIWTSTQAAASFAQPDPPHEGRRGAVRPDKDETRRRGVRGADPGIVNPAAELACARDEIGSRAAGDIERGIARLSLVLRLAPDLAADVLDALSRGRPRREATAMIVRGDACRLLGRHLEAEAAYTSAAGALASTARDLP
ncbi:MAG: hypothetical protein HW391_575 [Chloroflexi bacterium]|nr:hypothetical protein [Chloroflexota bacterium]